LASDREELQALRRLAELEAKAGKAAPMQTPEFEKEAAQIASVTPAEAIAANPIVRAATAAARPILAANNMLVRPLGLQGVPLEQLDEMQRRGAMAQGFSPAVQTTQDIAGSLISPVGVGAIKTAAAPTAVGRIAQGAGFGALGGVTAGTQDPMASAQTGAVVGGLVPGAIEGIRAGGKGIQHLTDLFRGKEGAANILNRYQRNIIGEGNVPAVVQKLKEGSVSPVSGYQPTAAEAVQGLPAGSPIVAHQRATARTPGGPSAAFGDRVQQQKAALQAAYEARDAATEPLRTAAIQQANAGGVMAKNVTDKIDDLLSQPGIRASDVVSGTLNKTKDKIASLTKDGGTIDAADLYTIRKEVGNTIKTFSKETANWDKRLTSALERDVQKAIDGAIESAGGTTWKKYLAEYSARSQAIGKTKETALAAMRPEQRTDLFGGINVAEQTRAHFPQMLSRPVMIANAILKKFSTGVEPHIDTLATRRYLNPQELASALEKMPSTQRNQIVDAMERAGVATAILGTREAEQ
jgi:hypothetical protein